MSGDAQRRLILNRAVSLDGFVARRATSMPETRVNAR
jgi:hypothetical protein